MQTEHLPNSRLNGTDSYVLGRSAVILTNTEETLRGVAEAEVSNVVVFMLGHF